MTTPSPDRQVETLEEIAQGIAVRGLPFSAFKDSEDFKRTREWLQREILSALRRERERCAKIVNDARGESYDLRSLVSAIREGR